MYYFGNGRDEWDRLGTQIVQESGLYYCIVKSSFSEVRNMTVTQIELIQIKFKSLMRQTITW